MTFRTEQFGKIIRVGPVAGNVVAVLQPSVLLGVWIATRIPDDVHDLVFGLGTQDSPKQKRRG